MSMENIGRAATPQGIGHNQHRGIPQYTPEEMHRRHPTIRVAGAPWEERRAKPHEFRSTLTGPEYRGKCDWEGERPNAAIHRF